MISIGESLILTVLVVVSQLVAVGFQLTGDWLW
jgi:hypothetical protein